MPRLPDLQDFGARPVPQSQRGVAQIDTRGGGLAGIGRAIRVAGAEMERKSDLLGEARAKAALDRSRLDVQSEFAGDTDFGTLEERWGKRMQGAVDQAAAHISDSTARQIFIEGANNVVLRDRVGVQDTAREGQNQFKLAGLYDDLEETRTAAVATADPAERDRLIGDMAGMIDAAVADGLIDPVSAGATRRKATKDFVLGWLNTLSPEERLEALGGASAGPGQSPTTTLPGPAGRAISIAADKHGVPEDYLRRVAWLESRGDPLARNPSGASGLFQFMPATAQEFGVGNPFDPDQAADGAARYAQRAQSTLRDGLGRDPTPSELYLAHQQGAGGAYQLLAARPGEMAVDALARAYNGDRAAATRAVTQNGGTANMSAESFVRLWDEKYRGARLPSRTGTAADFLDLDERTELAAAAMRDLEIERNQREREYLSGFDAYLAAVGSGADVSADIANRYSNSAINAVVPDERQRSMMIAVRDDTLLQSGFAAAIHGAPPEQIAAMSVGIEALTQTVQDDVGLALAPARAQAQASLQKAIAADAKARMDDPAAYTLDMEAVASAAEGVGRGGEARYADVTLAEQARIGIPEWGRRVLTAPVAAEMVAAVNGTEPAGRGLAVQQLAQQWGPAWPQVLRELKMAKLDPAAYHAALVADDPVLSERVAALATTPVAELTKGMVETEVRDLKASVGEELSDFRTVFEAGDPSGSATATFNELSEIAVGLALQEFRQTGDASNAVTNATDRLVNDRYTVLNGRGFSAYVPRGFDAALVEDAARQAMSDEALAEIIPFGGDEGSPDFIRLNRIRMAAKRGTWVTNATGDGLILMADVDGRAMPLMTDGGVYGIKFADAEKVGVAPVTVAPSPGPIGTIGP